MCYSIVSVQEVVRIANDNNYDVAEFSHCDFNCLQEIEDNEKCEWSIISRKDIDNVNWFSTEDARRLGKEYAIKKSAQYPNKVVVLIEGVQSCSGGFTDLGIAQIYDANGNIVTQYEAGHVKKSTNIHPTALNSEQIEKIKIRQIEIEKEEDLAKIKYDNYMKKIIAFASVSTEAYNIHKNTYKMRGTSYSEKHPNGVYIRNNREKDDPLNIAYQEGARVGFLQGLAYIQKNRELLDALVQNFITPEEDNVV